VHYTPIVGSGGQWLASMYDSQNAPSALLKAREDLWNGNIGAMQTNLKKPHNAAPTPGVTDRPGMLGMAYRYDQLNRLVDAVGHSASYIAAPGNAAEFNRWQVSETQAHLYRNSFTYDPNGNIETQKRWDEMGVLFEDLAYQYNKLDGEIIQNRLYHVNDAISASAQEGDIEDQGTFYDAQNQIKTDNNYLYTAIGELQVDKSEDIEEIVWRVDSKIAEVRRTSNSTKKNLRFDYDAMGNRIAKHIYTDNAFTLLEKSTYYVRDASGNVMAVYDRIIDASVETGEFMLSERHIYGSSRIGMDVSTHVFGLDPYTSLTETTRELGHKQYEISNHLGNVLSVITDQKLPVEEDDIILSYTAVIVTATDYSPFGVGLYGRSWSGEYRFGFNGHEILREYGSTKATTTAEFWLYDPILARRMNPDPLHQFNSDFLVLGNCPIRYNDPLGAWVPTTDGEGNTLLQGEEGDTFESLVSFLNLTKQSISTDQLNDLKSQFDFLASNNAVKGNCIGLDEPNSLGNFVGGYLMSMYETDKSWGYVDAPGYDCSPTLAMRVRMAVAYVYGESSDEHNRLNRSTPEGSIGYNQFQNNYGPYAAWDTDGDGNKDKYGIDNYRADNAASFGLTDAMRRHSVAGAIEYAGVGVYVPATDVWSNLKPGAVLGLTYHTAIFVKYETNSKGVVTGMYIWDDHNEERLIQKGGQPPARIGGNFK